MNIIFLPLDHPKSSTLELTVCTVFCLPCRSVFLLSIGSIKKQRSPKEKHPQVQPAEEERRRGGSEAVNLSAFQKKTNISLKLGCKRASHSAGCKHQITPQKARRKADVMTLTFSQVLRGQFQVIFADSVKHSSL